MAMVFNNGMKDMLVPMDQEGRIVLPKKIREGLAIKSGDLFKVGIHGTSVTLTPSKQTAGFVRRGKALVFTTRGNEMLSLETVNAALEEGREELEKDELAKRISAGSLPELEAKLLAAAESLDAGKSADGEEVFARLRKRIKARHSNA
jgi:AbrB family looped-hinge helix DNA binding protein